MRRISSMATGKLRSLIFDVQDGRATFSVLDQLALPHETKYCEVKNVEDAWDAIRSMVRRAGTSLRRIVIYFVLT